MGKYFPNKPIDFFKNMVELETTTIKLGSTMTKKSERTKKDGNKLKLLYMMELLRSSATEKHPLTMDDITAELKKYGIMCERRTFGNDMRLLMETFHVKKTKVGRKNGYYILSRALSDTEIKMLIDTVQAASFLSDSMTEFFVKKLSRIGGKELAKRVKENYILFNVKKRNNIEIFDSVEAIRQALTKEKKISFVYNDLNYEGERVARKGGERYFATPLSLVVNDDKYYCMCRGEKDGIIKFRVDRMTEVMVEEKLSAKKAELEKRKDITKYLSEVIGMFTGETENVNLRFRKDLAEMIFDQFGEKLECKEVSETEAETVVSVSVAPTFFSWLSTFRGGIKIAGPIKVASAYKEFLKDNLANV